MCTSGTGSGDGEVGSHDQGVFVTIKHLFNNICVLQREIERETVEIYRAVHF